MKSNLGEAVPLGICGQKELSSPPCGKELGGSVDVHPIEGAPFLQQEDLSGVRGRARERKTYRNLVVGWTNCVLVAIKDLFAGRLSDRLLHLSSGMSIEELEKRACGTGAQGNGVRGDRSLCPNR